MPLVRCLLIGLLLGAAVPSSPAQPLAPPESLQVDALRTPAAPGFLLLDVAPTAVERPQTPRALALSLLSAAGQDNLLPQNYALEVAPYWLVSHPTLTYTEYYEAGPGAALLQTLSLSMATLPLDPDDPGAGTRVAFGLRTQPFAGSTNHLDPLFDRLRTIQEAILLTEDPAVLDTLTAAAQDVALQIQDANTQRTGFILEIAAAAVWAFPRDDFEEAALERLGVWITPAYRLTKPDLDLLGVARLLRPDAGAFDNGTLLDLGGRLRWAWGPFALGAEAVGRLVLETPRLGTGSAFEDSYRLNATLEYDVSSDMQLFASFGRNYEDRIQSGNLIALIGVNYGLGRRPFVRTPR